MAKGTYAQHQPGHRATSTARFERLQAGDAEVVQEPTDQPYGVRDCAVRDPAGNLIRIQELQLSTMSHDHGHAVGLRRTPPTATT